MRRHSDTLRGAQRRRKRGLRGENNRTSFLRSKVVVFPSYSKDIVFSRTCAGKRHPESRERGDRKGANGGKREGERSERESVVPRQKKEEVNGGENGLSEAITRCRPRHRLISRPSARISFRQALSRFQYIRQWVCLEGNHT